MPDTPGSILRQALPEAVLDTGEVFTVPQIRVAAPYLLRACELLASLPETAYDYLEDITAIDWQDRIEVVYALRSIAGGSRISLRVDLERERPTVDSITSVYKGADYQEREVFDLMGVSFENHPDLRRILLPDDWEGYPLRKDYVIPED